MGCSDKGEIPPPLPVKGNTADYGNLLDNQDLTSPSTPPPPPPHQRVGVLIRDEKLLNDAWHFQWNKNPTHTWHSGQPPFIPPWWCFSPPITLNFTVLANAHGKRIWASQLVIRSTLLLFVLALCPVPPPPVQIRAQTWLIGWLLCLSRPSGYLLLLISGSSHSCTWATRVLLHC